MWLADPAFLNRPPAKPVQLVLLSALLWTSLPLLWALPLGVSTVFGVMWLLRLVLWQRQTPPLPRLALLGLLVLVLALVWQQLGTLIGREGGLAFLLLLSVLKAYESRQLRDWQVLLLVMLLVMGGGILFNQNIAILLWLVAGLCLLSAAMAMLGGLNFAAAWRQGAAALGLALPLAAVLFVAVPRMAEPLWRIPQPDNKQATTGLSDTLEPGSISNLVQSNEPAFNAVFTEGTPQQQDLYWRVIVMGDNEQGQWRAIDEQYTDDARPRRNGPTLLSYHLILEDQKGRVPALDYPILTDERYFSYRVGAVVRANRSREGYRRISLQSAVSPYLAQTLGAGERDYYTRLPANGNPRTRALAQTLRQQHPDDRRLAEAVLAHFRNQRFVYTLQPARNDGADVTDYFLFQGREGFCEDYANAFVWLMRAAGVPARIVTGYQGGEYVSQGNFWQVRSKDAHAWAEIWLASENAWLRIDPTTAVAEVRASQGLSAALPENEQPAFADKDGWLYRLGQSSQFYWQQWVVNFDANRQQNLFQRLGLGSVNIGSISLLLLVGGALAAVPLWLWWRRVRRRSSDYLREGLWLIQQQFDDGRHDNPAAAGPLELQQHPDMPETVKALLDDYIRHVYAGNLPAAAVQKRWYRAVKKALRQVRAGIEK
nr:DUF3488 and transglutaminase-like domain-containing protein [Neisseria sp. HSC-16F19]